VGAGSSLEAPFTLAGAIRAGTWHFIGDGLVLDAVDMRFDVLWRAGGSDVTLVTFRHHYDPPPAGPTQFDAVTYEADAAGIAVAAHAGDTLVLRFTVENGPTMPSFVPNGDGAKTMGRIPSLKLPE
jgi:hypothetical protein